MPVFSEQHWAALSDWAEAARTSSHKDLLDTAVGLTYDDCGEFSPKLRTAAKAVTSLALSLFSFDDLYLQANRASLKRRGCDCLATDYLRQIEASISDGMRQVYLKQLGKTMSPIDRARDDFLMIGKSPAEYFPSLQSSITYLALSGKGIEAMADVVGLNKLAPSERVAKGWLDDIANAFVDDFGPLRNDGERQQAVFKFKKLER